MIIDNALVPNVAVAAGLTGIFATASVAVLWLQTRGRLNHCGKELKRLASDLDTMAQSLCAFQVSSNETMQKVEEKISTAVEGALPVHLPAQSMNRTRRSRALSMKRRGDDEHLIAASLNIPSGELELLFKVEQLVADSAEYDFEYR